MQLKTALLSTAVVAALAGLAFHSARSDTPTGLATAGPAAQSVAGHASAAATTAANTAQLSAHRSNMQLLTDTGARPGSELAAASTSPAEADASPAADRARQLLASGAAREVNLVKADGFVARDVMIDRDGTEHVRMERTYEGLPVIGGDMVVHSRNGELTSISQGDNMRTTLRPSLKPGISAEQARVEAGAKFDGTVASLDPAKLVVYARGGAEPTLAYQVGLQGERNDRYGPGVMSYFLDARTGKLLEAEDHFQTAAANGTGKTLTLGNVGIVTNSVSGGFQLTDPSRGNGQTLDARNSSSTFSAVAFSDSDNVWGNNAISDRATAAADAHYGVAATWDYFKSVHARNGIFNDGKGVKSYVHYGQNYFNAGWNGSYMIYGDGDATNGNTPLVALDVAGHEMSRGVNTATANLGYYNIKDSGGINEANSDILGTLVEYSVGNALDKGDYLIGEEVYPASQGATKALRQMFKQDVDGKSFACYPSGGFTASLTGQRQKYDPHNTSGVGNRFFYVLAEGVTIPAGFSYTKAQLVCNNDTTVAGIGRAKAGAIWYRALTKYFVSSTTYPQARTGTLQAATDLYGANSTEYQTVARAWSAAGVN
jgi:Zn-dependent metalloprotease